MLSFDVAAYTMLDIQDVGDEVNRESLARAWWARCVLAAGRISGRRLLAADEMLRDDPSQLKHIILLTDGGADPRRNCAGRGSRCIRTTASPLRSWPSGRITRQWLHDVAAAGHGQFHLAYDVSTIPAIFTAETVLATRSYIFEEDFFPDADGAPSDHEWS